MGLLKFRYAILVLLILFNLNTIVAQESSGLNPELLAYRADYSASGHALKNTRHVSLRTTEVRRVADVGVMNLPGDSAAALSAVATALDLPIDWVEEMRYEGDETAVAVLDDLGVIKPQRGDNFLVMSTGFADSRGTTGPYATEWGADLGAIGSDGDKAVLSVDIALPEGVHSLHIPYHILSVEYPEYLDTEFRLFRDDFPFEDPFSITLQDGDNLRTLVDITLPEIGRDWKPVSQTNSAGSGYNVFAWFDPEGFDVQLLNIGNIPDAGLTGFRLASAEVRGGQTITLTFSIEDDTDGLNDTSVLLDNIIVSSIEMVDPAPALELDSSDTHEELAHGGSSVVRASADGETEVLLRLTTPGSGTVEFCRTGTNVFEDGSLSRVGEGAGNACVQVPTVGTTRGPMAFAVYHVPEGFNNSGSYDAQDVRPIDIQASFSAGSGLSIISSTALQLTRPAIVLVHGFSSNPGSWTFPLVNDPRYTIGFVDYEATNARGLAANFNAGHPIQGIVATLNNQRLNYTAATQVNLVGVSMGGMISRYYLGRPEYGLLNNANRLITMNSPHFGSHLATFLGQIHDNPTIGTAFTDLLRDIHWSIDEGAFDDLRYGSPAIRTLPAVPVESHALYGIFDFSSTYNYSVIPKWGLLFTGLNLACQLHPITSTCPYWIDFGFDAIFGTPDHDFVVSAESQRGGLPNAAVTEFFGPDGFHTAPNNSPLYSARVIELLELPPGSEAFSYFPAPADHLPPAPALSAPSSQPQLITPTALIDGGIQIQFVNPPAPVRPGDTLQVQVQPNAGLVIENMMLFSTSIAVYEDTTPLLVNLVVPDDIAGVLEIGGLAGATNGDFYSATPIAVTVVPNASLDKVSILPKDVFVLEPHSSHQLSVFGTYSDGQIRHISNLSTLRYTSSNVEIATVSTDGLVETEGPGVVTLVAYVEGQDGKQDSITIQVLAENQRPVANAGINQTISVVGSPVTLDGRASSDPDGQPLPLTYDWAVIDKPVGTTVILSDPTVAQPGFTADQEGTYTFSLVVGDGLENSTPSRVNVYVTTDQPNYDQSPALNIYTTSTPTLTWNHLSWATGYEIQIATDSRFRNVVDGSSTLDANTFVFTTTPLTNGTYYWRVRGQRANGSWGRWSNLESITINVD